MNEQQPPLGTIIAKTLQDETFKQQLIADPAAVFKAEGVAMPEGITLRVVADTASVRHLVLPAASLATLSDGELDAVAGGNAYCGTPINVDGVEIHVEFFA